MFNSETIVPRLNSWSTGRTCGPHLQRLKAALKHRVYSPSRHLFQRQKPSQDLLIFRPRQCCPTRYIRYSCVALKKISPGAGPACLQSRPLTNRKHLLHHKNKTNPAKKSQDRPTETRMRRNPSGFLSLLGKFQNLYFPTRRLKQEHEQQHRRL